MTKVLLLNGCSSAGKTTLAEKLQQYLPEPYQYVSLDQFRDGMPMRVRGLNAPQGSEGAQGLNVVPTSSGLTEIRFGSYGREVLKQMRRSIAGFAAAGINVIVDDLLLEQQFLDDYCAVLPLETTWFIGVHCDLEVIEQREAARPGRFPGTATSHYERVHLHGAGYDLEVDTSATPPFEIAQSIVAQLNGRPEALRQYVASRQPG